MDCLLIPVDHSTGIPYGSAWGARVGMYSLLALFWCLGHMSWFMCLQPEIAKWLLWHVMMQLRGLWQGRRGDNLTYPAAFEIDELAHKGKIFMIFHALWQGRPLEFSFSGLKSAFITYITMQNRREKVLVKEDLCASFQAAVLIFS